MSEKFHKRFNIDVLFDEAQRRLVNRIHNAIWNKFLYELGNRDVPYLLKDYVITHLGERFKSNANFSEVIGDNFQRNLQALEACQEFVSRELGSGSAGTLDVLIETYLSHSETDLGIRWEKGHFYPSGSALLDEKVVNDVLGLLDNPTHAGAAQAFHKGLNHFLHSTKDPALLADVITDMYDALEHLPKIVCGNDKGINVNRDGFTKKLDLHASYNKMLAEYIDYANLMARHAGEQGQAKPLPSRPEVEAFMYLTGLFIRLALTKTDQ